MGKKKARPSPEKPKEPADYYDLKTQAVDDLVTANEQNSPPVPAAELRKYRSGPQIKLADWLKVILLKCWAGGMLCYFFIWGLSTITLNQLDHLFILGVALGLVNNLIVNNILRFIAATPGKYDRWMMFPGKSFLFIIPDMLYAMLLIVCVTMTYNGINLLLSGPVLGVEPILFGIILTLWDLLFLGCKRLFKRVVADARGKVTSGK